MTLITPELSQTPSMPPPEEKKEMLSLREENGKKILRINSSSLSVMQECWRKTNFKLVRELTQREGSPALIAGSAIHKALEVFYCGKREERTLPVRFMKQMELMSNGVRVDGEEELLVYRATRAFLDAAGPLSSLPPTNKRSVYNLLWILGHYMKTYIDDPYEVLWDSEGPMIERRGEMEIYDSPELKIVFFGTLDFILENKANGQILPGDHKTSSVVGNKFFDKLKPNQQYAAYSDLCQKVFGVESSRFLINCIEIKSRGTTGRAAPPSLPRQVVSFSDWDYEECWDTYIYYAKEFLRRKEEEHWPLPGINTCTAMAFGSCEFLSVCQAPPNIRENILEAKYEAQ